MKNLNLNYQIRPLTRDAAGLLAEALPYVVSLRIKRMNKAGYKP